MEISRELAILILKYCFENTDFYFPFIVMCKEYSSENDDFVEVCINEWKDIEDDENYQTFELWENLLDLREDTTELLAKGFIEKIFEEKTKKKFIFLTSEGFSQDSNGNEIENMQTLGISEGNSKKEAFEDLKNKNEWLLETGFDDIYCHELKDVDFDYFYLKSK